jgi:hypothetical protein
MIWWIIYFSGFGFTAAFVLLASLLPSSNSLWRNWLLNIAITVLWPIPAVVVLWNWYWDQ